VLFRNPLCLAVDGANLEKVQRVARDFRGCTTTVKVGPTLMLAWGPYAVRGLGELGMSDIILDSRLFGNHQEIWTAISEAAQIRSVKGLTVQATCGPDILAMAVEAADKSKSISQRGDTPKIIGSLVPPVLDAPALHSCMVCASSRREYVCELARLCCQAGLHGALVEYEDIPMIREVCNIPLIGVSRRKIENYSVRLSPEEMRQPGVVDVLKAGARHAVLGMELVGFDAEWSADMVRKDIIAWKGNQ